MSDPWLSCVVGSEPARSNSTSSACDLALHQVAREPADPQGAAAQCELDDPRITGPMTSLKMLICTMG